MNKPILPFVETMITQHCNLSCHGCSNYSDLRHSGYVDWQTGKKSISQWLERIEIPDFGIIGGEPLLNPDVEKWIVGLRELMPAAQIRFTTNGLLLHKKFHVIKLLEEIGNCVFKITVHLNDKDLEKNIKKIHDMYDWQEIHEFGIQRYTTGDRFRYHVKRPEIFLKTYKGTYKNMMPYKNNPHDAFDICSQTTCPLLYNSKIYKCSTNGLLQDTLKKVGNPNPEHWAPYLHTGLSIDCSDQELSQFVENFGKPHSMCGMCPGSKDKESRLNHSENVSRKKNKIN
jgi:organic radical activating enzyme